MTQSKHTLGPWMIRFGGRNEYGKKAIICPTNGQGYNVAEVTRWGDDSVNIDDDTRLIAAAPDLLDALQELLDWHDIRQPDTVLETCKAVEKAQAAIAKATGGQ